MLPMPTAAATERKGMAPASAERRGRETDQAASFAPAVSDVTICTAMPEARRTISSGSERPRKRGTNPPPNAPITICVTFSRRAIAQDLVRQMPPP